ncbi:hypothetical protein FRC12_001223 [Ceratobasidium sp. 428]|nr:hypothetical protein FRC12_001223 [Ceratobasidium sp. 428]
MMSSSSANFFGLYGQSPRQTAALYVDARNSMRQASVSSAASRQSMQSYRSGTTSYISEDYEFVDGPQGARSSSETANTPPPPYSCRASVLPETLPAPSFAASEPPSNSKSPTPTSSRAQKRRSSVMIKDLGMRILCAK